MKVRGCRGHGLLTDEQVTAIRTSGMTDEYFARLYQMSGKSIRAARKGLSYKHVATPPDVVPRAACGRLSKLNPVAKLAKPRREWIL